MTDLINYRCDFDVADYTFTVCGNELSIEKNCKKIGECKAYTELIGWLLLLLEFVINQRHVKEFRKFANIQPDIRNIADDIYNFDQETYYYVFKCCHI